MSTLAPDAYFGDGEARSGQRMVRRFASSPSLASAMGSPLMDPEQSSADTISSGCLRKPASSSGGYNIILTYAILNSS